MKNSQSGRLTFTEAGLSFIKDLQKNLHQPHKQTNISQDQGENNKSKQKLIPQSSHDTSMNYPQKHLSILRQQILNAKNDDEKLIEILLPEITKQKAYSVSDQSSGTNISRVSNFLMKKVQEVKIAANEEDKKIKKTLESSFKLYYPSVNSPKIAVLDRSNIIFPSVESSPRNQLNKSKLFYQYPAYTKNMKKTNLYISTEFDTSRGGDSYLNSPGQGYKQPQQNNQINQLETEESSKLSYLSSRLDKIYKKNSLRQINYEAIQTLISKKYTKMCEIEGLDNRAFDLNPIKQQYQEKIAILEKNYKDEEVRKKQNLQQLHKHKYLNYWKDKPILIGSKNVGERELLFKNKSTFKKSNNFHDDQFEINRMKALFYQRS